MNYAGSRLRPFTTPAIRVQSVVMRIDVVSLFPDACDNWCDTSIVGRAAAAVCSSYIATIPDDLLVVVIVWWITAPLVVVQGWFWLRRPLPTAGSLPQLQSIIAYFNANSSG